MKEAIIKLIKQYPGKCNAIPVSKITDMLPGDYSKGLTNPRTRKVIRDIITENKIPIGSCSRGYFLIQTKSEMSDYILNLEGRIVGIQARINSLTGINV